MGPNWGPPLPSGKVVAQASMGPDRGKSPTLGCPQCGGSNPVWPGQNFHYVIYEPPKGHPVFTKDSRSWGGLWGNSSYVSYYLDTLARPGGMQTNLEASNASKVWAHPETGTLHTFQHAYWGNEQFRIVSRDNRSGSDTFTLGYGGWQEARGNDGTSLRVISHLTCTLSPPDLTFFYHISELYSRPGSSDLLSGSPEQVTSSTTAKSITSPASWKSWT